MDWPDENDYCSKGERKMDIDNRTPDMDTERDGLEHELFEDLAIRALDPEWQEEHHKMGFYSPLYEVMHMFDEDEDDG